MTEKEAWIAFSCFPQIGPARFGLLVEYFGSALKAWGAPLNEFREIGFSPSLSISFEEHRKTFNLESYLKQLSTFQVDVCLLGDKAYPVRLAHISDAPSLLYVRGEKNLRDLCGVSLAVVGTRKMTSYGKEMTEKFVSGLVDAGVTIISGLALGIDSVAHKTAVGLGGTTVAVLGNGLDSIYPPRNRQLGELIVQKGGSLISEYPLGYPAMPQNFPVRNRIVSGVSLGVLVIEGSEKSGTLLTASAAANQGREVFAVPGPVTSRMSWVPHHLIRNGAKLVEKAEDILQELNIETKKLKNIARQVLPETEEEQKIWQVLEAEGLDIDSLVRISGLSTAVVLATLTTMELKGMVKNVGGMYIRNF